MTCGGTLENLIRTSLMWDRAKVSSNHAATLKKLHPNQSDVGNLWIKYKWKRNVLSMDET